jgi:hypothetical protein
MITREPIYLALFNLLQTLQDSAKVVTVSRKLRHWADVPPAQQPAIFIIQRGEDPIQVVGSPTIWKLNVDLFAYVISGDDPTDSAVELLNPIIDQIESLFPPSEEDGPKQTLGGLVYRAFISGNIETSEGVLGQQEVAVIPIEILIT